MLYQLITGVRMWLHNLHWFKSGMGIWIDELLWMLSAEWPIVQLTVRIGRDQITEQAMTWSMPWDFRSHFTAASLSPTALWNAWDGTRFKKAAKQHFLAFPQAEKVIQRTRRDVFKEQGEREGGSFLQCRLCVVQPDYWCFWECDVWLSLRAFPEAGCRPAFLPSSAVRKTHLWTNLNAIPEPSLQHGVT